MSDTSETTTTDSNTNRRQPFPQGFLDTIGTGWADRADEIPAPREAAAFAATRRDALSAQFVGQRLVIPAGSFKQRSNDTDFPFRAHSAFTHLTGWGADAVADSVLVFDPAGEAHDVTLFLRDRAGTA